MSGTTNQVLTAGDVLRYSPAGGTHARECVAYVLPTGRVVDTFWHTFESDSNAHVLSVEELRTAEVVFNVRDYDALGRYAHGARETWLTYRPCDRGRISSQHNLQELLFVRKGAQPDLDTQIANAREKVEDAESKVRSAESGLQWAREDLAKLEARR